MTSEKKSPPQKGELFWRKTGWYGRWYATVDGERVRVAKALGTDNKAVAAKKLQRLVASGQATTAEAKRVETFTEAAERIVEQQGETGMKTWAERLSRLRRYALPHIGHLPIDRVRPPQVLEVLNEAHKAGLEKQGVVHVRNDVSSVFLQLWREELVAENLVKRVKLPKNLKVDGRARVILSDDECTAFFASSDVAEHVRLMALASRCFGGLRTSDLHAWDWSHVKTDTWESSKVYRPKTDDEHGATELVEQRIPDMLAEPLKAWWRRWKKREDTTDGPLSGPVFPVMKGARAGERQGKRSHARELRNALWHLGIVRPLAGFDEAFARLEVARGHLASAQADPKQKGTLRALRAEVQRLDDEARARCALQSNTERTKCVDFHSFRRAYNTALANAGVNAQTAMRLAGHSQMRTHMRYVMSVEILETPEAALPRALAVPTLGAVVETTGDEVPGFSHLFGRPHRESNPGYRRERPMS